MKKILLSFFGIFALIGFLALGLATPDPASGMELDFAAMTPEDNESITPVGYMAEGGDATASDTKPLVST